MSGMTSEEMGESLVDDVVVVVCTLGGDRGRGRYDGEGDDES